MDFYYIGKRCEMQNCKQHDFLPFQCKYCTGNFCLEHRFFENHNCKNYKDNIKLDQNEKKIYNQCFACGKNNIIEIKCKLCHKVVCINHRHGSNETTKYSHKCKK